MIPCNELCCNITYLLDDVNKNTQKLSRQVEKCERGKSQISTKLKIW